MHLIHHGGHQGVTEDCLYKARWGIKEHVALLKEQGLTIPPENPDPKIIVQNEKKLAEEAASGPTA
jgi:hypothetical protein